MGIAIISQSYLNDLGLISTTLSDGRYLRFSIIISGDLDGRLDHLSPSFDSVPLLILVIHEITAYILMCTESHTCSEAEPCILLPLLPDCAIPPAWVKVCKVHSVIEIGIPLIPRIDVLMTVCGSLRQHTFRLVESHPPSHMRLELCSALRRFYKVAFGSPSLFCLGFLRKPF